jgi:hypothetical protein
MIGNIENSDELCERSAGMFRELGEPRALNVATRDLGICAMERGHYARARELLEQSLVEAQGHGFEIDVGWALVELGVLALHERRYEDSVPLFVQGLESAIRHGVRVNVFLSLRGLAAATAVRGDLESAARMLGAAATLQERTGEGVHEPYERPAFEEALAPIAERADEPPIAAALAAGRKMTESEATSFALGTATEQVAIDR